MPFPPLKSPQLRALGASFAAGIIASVSLAQPAAADQVTPGNFTGYAFDQCLAPNQAAMDAWMEHSPFSAVGIYISGDSRACRNQPNLTRTWVTKQLNNGWRLLPITLGPQANCLSRFPRYRDDKVISAKKTNNYAAARKQAREEAVKTANAAAKLGIDRGSTLWYDLEAFDIKNTVCRESAMLFLSAYNKKIKSLGYVAGVYSSAASGIKALDDARLKTPTKYVLPDAIWIADWDGRANLTSKYFSDTGWTNHQRVKQYRGDHKETWGGVTINIDSNFLSLGKGSFGTPGGHQCREKVQTNLTSYPPLNASVNNKTAITVLQCLLRKAKTYSGPLTGVFDARTLNAANAFQRKNNLTVRKTFTRAQWTSLHASGISNTLKRGSKGAQVRSLQRALTASTGTTVPVTGVFDAGTEAAVKAWQKKLKRTSSGVVNQSTIKVLRAGKTTKKA